MNLVHRLYLTLAASLKWTLLLHKTTNKLQHEGFLQSLEEAFQVALSIHSVSHYV